MILMCKFEAKDIKNLRQQSQIYPTRPAKTKIEENVFQSETIISINQYHAWR